MKSLRVVLLALALAVYASFAVRSLLGRRDADRVPPPAGRLTWIAGPSSATLEAGGRRRVDRALELLRDETAPIGDRLERYRAALVEAERLFVAALRACPIEPRTLARLAAIRFEIEGLGGQARSDGPVALVELASRRAPDAPAVQALLGETLVRMGRPEEALLHFRRAVEADRTRSGVAVGRLREGGLAAQAIREGLPEDPAVLVALQDAYFEEGRAADYLDLLEGALRSDDPRLVRILGDACLRAGDPGRLLAALDRLPSPSGPEDEARRLVQSGRALLALDRPADALAAARRARDLAPEDYALHEHVGRAALAAGDSDEAIRSFRDALRSAARAGATAAYRAKLYRQIGQAEERRGRRNLALEAYGQALALDPADAIAAARRARIEASAAPPPPPGSER